MLSKTDSTSNILINLKIRTNDQFGDRSSKPNWFQTDKSSNQWSNWFQFGNIPQKQLNNTNHGREMILAEAVTNDQTDFNLVTFHKNN